MSLLRRDPFMDLLPVRDAIEEIFEERFLRPEWLPRWERRELVALDVYETPEKYIVKAALPGIKPDDVDITITGELLTIRGEFKLDEEATEKGYHRRELRYGKFERSLALPSSLETDKAKAVFEHGMLIVTVPKTAPVLPHHIKITPTVEATK